MGRLLGTAAHSLAEQLTDFPTGWLLINVEIQPKLPDLFLVKVSTRNRRAKPREYTSGDTLPDT